MEYSQKIQTYMLRNFGKHSEITMESIEENLELLKKIILD